MVGNIAVDQKERIGRAIGRIASGVFIITLERNGERDGFMASWVGQAAFEPPMITVAIKKGRHILDLMGIGTTFTVNVLSKKNMDIFKSFVKPYAEGMDRFEGLPLMGGPKAGPVFSESIAYLDCTTRTMVEAGDHVLVVGEIFHGGMLEADQEPIVHLRSNGFQY